jgi:hypothetical protein
MAWKSKYPIFPNLNEGALGDCRERLARVNRGFESMPTDKESEQYDEDCTLEVASLIKLFVEAVKANENPTEDVLSELARRLEAVLEGDPWEQGMPLPGRVWREEWDTHSPTDRKAMDYCRFVRYRIQYEKALVTQAIADVALEKHVSFETVRAAYYKWKSWFEELEEYSKKEALKLEDEKAAKIQKDSQGSLD